MLIQLILHIIISFVCLGSGFILNHLFSPLQPGKKYKAPIIYLITGLIALTAISQLLALWIPINIYVQLPLVVLVLLLLTLKRTLFRQFIIQQIKSRLWPFYTALAISWLLILILNAGPTMMDDTDSYHIQMIKWIREFGSVPGLVHLHERLGFNSSWFSSIAFFSIANNHENYYTTLNGVISIWFTGYFLSFIRPNITWPKGVSLSMILVLLICFVSWPVIRGNASSANYDAISWLMIFVLFSETLFRPETSRKLILNEWIIWPAFLITVRIIYFPLLLLSLFPLIFLIRKKQFKQICLLFLIIGFITIPFFVRNVIISGYLLYPSLYPDFFNVDWKADRATTETLLHFIKYYNRVGTGIIPLEQTAAMNSYEWIAAWIKHMFLYSKIIFFPGIVGFLLFPFVWTKIEFFRNRHAKVFVAVLALQIFVWFIIAPDPRFIYGCLLCGWLILLLSLFELIRYTPSPKLTISLMILLSVALLVFTLRKITEGESIALVRPVNLPQPATTNITIDHLQLSIPEKINGNWNARCFDTPLPCIYELKPGLRLRGPSIKDGFKSVKSER